MKKLFSSICAIAMMFLLVVPAFGATKQEVSDEIPTSLTTNKGDVITFPSKYIKLAQDALANGTFTADQLDTVLRYIEFMMRNAKPFEATSWEDLNKNYPSDVEWIKSNLKLLADQTGCTISVDSKNEVSISQNGKIIGKTVTASTGSTSSNNVIKKTGSDIDVSPVVFTLCSIIAAVGAIAVFSAKKRLFVKGC